MGWSFQRGATKAQVVAELLKPWDTTVTPETAQWHGLTVGTRVQSHVVTFRVVGDNLWIVRMTTKTAPDSGVTVEKWIGLSLLDKQDGWGHKDMEEAMGPYEVNCPFEFLDLAPMPDSPYAASWREKVRQYAAMQLTRPGLPVQNTLAFIESRR